MPIERSQLDQSQDDTISGSQEKDLANISIEERYEGINPLREYTHISFYHH
jgi:hypothetical protein